MLPQGERIEAFFGVSHSLMKEPRLRPFSVSVRFQDLNGRDYRDEYELDVAQFIGLELAGSPPEHEIAETLKKIETSIAQLVGRNLR